MRVRWTEAAAADLGRIADYLFVHAPSRAPGLVRFIYEAPLPWIVIYTVRDDAIDIVRLLHGAQRWP